ncbi:hypothetical protein PRK78_004989 [Emydomyces testavorans]|uniref:Telomere-associated protein Rif1 N-terminal domain-containing protein n=1 Tax=Emydomyces testavorans TaxID=2070801 RepID=A0AAF0IJ35_9EURO|nr:hypothetical protein PRK78_004989 [Emydomyces testavorans]
MVDKGGLSALPARPPTPPRASSFHSVPSLQGSQPTDSNLQISPYTSDGHRSPPEISPHLLSQRGLKRVNFSPLTSYIKAPDLRTSHSKLRTPLRSLRPSKQCQPTKSILKSKAPASPDGLSDEPRSSPTDNLPTMLESVLQQLAGNCLYSRTDAYMQLAGSLAAYCDLPEVGALVEKMGLLTQFIRRDISITSGTLGRSEISLIHQASSLLCTLLGKPEFACHIPDDFKTLVLELTINCLQNPSMPKTIVIDDMRILSIQNFQPKILTSARVTQLLGTLKDITNRFNGKSIIAMRLSIYEKLLLQTRSSIASHANLWMDHLVTGMFYKLNEIRTRAIGFGFQVTSVLGTNVSISKSIQDILELPIEGGTKFVDELCSRMETMVANKDGSVHVPRIWSVIILLLRRPRLPVNEWPQFKKWIMVIQKCFNCSDLTTKIQALVAWDRLVYAIQTNESSGKDMTSFLSKPIFLQLERRKDENATPLINQAVSSYCNLVYYSFRPSTSYERLDLYWSEYISSPFLQRFNSSPSNMRIACNILAELFWNSHPKVWDERKALETARLKPEDLLRFDSKWVRSRISMILPIIESFLKNADWNNNTVPEPSIERVWIHLSKSLADASSKEIQPSPELMRAIAVILEMLQRLWKDVPVLLTASTGGSLDSLLRCFRFLLKTMISIIRPFPFTDKLLLKTTQETFQPAQTPTHRQARKDGVTRSPILHLFNLIVYSFHSSPTPEYCHLVNDVIELGISGHSSRGPQLEILRQLAEMVRENRTDMSETAFTCAHEAWKAISTVTKGCLKKTTVDTPNKQRDDTLCTDHNRVALILEAGNQFPDSSSEWTELFDCMVSIIHVEEGDVALSAAIDTVSESCSRASTLSIPRVVKLIGSIVFPNQNSSKQLPQFRNTIPNLKHQLGHQISCEKLLLLVSNTLKDVYAKQEDFSKSNVLALLEAVTLCLDKSPASARSTLLEQLQDGLSVWIADTHGQYSVSSGAYDYIPMAIRKMVAAVLRILRTAGNNDSNFLHQLTTLVASGFESRHRSTVNSFIREWNATFGVQKDLVYPDRVKSALRKLRVFADIQLPGWPEEPESKEPSQSLDFLSSSEELSVIETPLKPRNRQNKINKMASDSLFLITPSSSRNRDRNKRRGSPRKSNKHITPETRLRHENSQIHFVPVVSSPTSNIALETQLLTERQKDVRERQRLESATLLHGALSDAQSPRKAEPSVSKNIHGDSDHVSSDPLTPVIAAEPTTNEDDFSFSSPTPGSKEHNTQEFTEFSLSTLPPNFEWSSSPNIDAAFESSTSQKRKTPKKSTPATETRKKSSPTKYHFQVQNNTVVLEQTPARNQSNSGDVRNDKYEQHSSAATDSMTNGWPLSSYDSPMNHSGSEGPAKADHSFLPTVLDASENFEIDREDVDLIPDSFSDQLEQQIASQLEQDLGLSIDLELHNSQKTKRAPRASTRAKKRKRDDADTLRKDRAKRISPSSRVSVDTSRVSNPEPSDPERKSPIQADSSRVLDRQSAKPQRKNRRSTKSSQSKALSQPQSRKSNSSDPQTGPQRRSLRLRGKSAVQEMEQISERANVDMDIDAPTEELDTVAQDSNSKDSIGDHDGPLDEATSSENNKKDGPKSPTTSILASLKSVLDSIKTVSFERSFLREIDDIMFDIKMEAHDAVRRHE